MTARLARKARIAMTRATVALSLIPMVLRRASAMKPRQANKTMCASMDGKMLPIY